MQKRSCGKFKGSKEEPEPSGNESIEKGHKNDEGEPAAAASPAHQSFNEALYRWSKVLKDSGKPLPMADDKFQSHVMLVVYDSPTIF